MEVLAPTYYIYCVFIILMYFLYMDFYTMTLYQKV
jgi:hypothetical protein